MDQGETRDRPGQTVHLVLRLKGGHAWKLRGLGNCFKSPGPSVLINIAEEITI